METEKTSPIYTQIEREEERERDIQRERTVGVGVHFCKSAVHHLEFLTSAIICGNIRPSFIELPVLENIILPFEVLIHFFLRAFSYMYFCLISALRFNFRHVGFPTSGYIR